MSNTLNDKLSSLANEQRREVVKVLSLGGALTIKEIRMAMGKYSSAHDRSEYSTRRMLSILEDAGIVTQVGEGPMRFALLEGVVADVAKAVAAILD